MPTTPHTHSHHHYHHYNHPWAFFGCQGSIGRPLLRQEVIPTFPALHLVPLHSVYRSSAVWLNHALHQHVPWAPAAPLCLDYMHYTMIAATDKLRAGLGFGV